MDKNTKTKVVAGAVGALVLALAVGAAGAIAASRALSGDEETQAVIDDAAGQLDIEPNELSDALKEALKNRVDEAVEDGRLTQEQGEELKERIDSGEYPLLFPGLGPRGGFDRPLFGDRGRFGHPGVFGGLDAAATYLGLTEEELHERLRDGETLAEIAEDEGKTVAGLVDAMVAEAEERIDEAVEDGRLTEERGDSLKQELEERITDLVNGERGGRPFGFGFHGFGPGGIEPRDFRDRGPRA